MMKQWAQKFDQLTRRERGLIAGAVFVFIGMLGYLPLESTFLAYQQSTNSTNQITQENGYAVQQIELLKQRLAIDPNRGVIARQQEIAKQMQAVEEQLAFEMVDMVPADHMPQLLSDLLAKVKGIRLQSFTSIPPVPLIEVGEQEKMNLYSHGIQLVVKGDYFSILKFIQAVEAMPDKMYWKRMDYQVERHPNSLVTLEIYTLSINEDFISVASQN